jgi:hypothetical protein
MNLNLFFFMFLYFNNLTNYIIYLLRIIYVLRYCSNILYLYFKGLLSIFFLDFRYNFRKYIISNGCKHLEHLKINNLIFSFGKNLGFL